MFSPSRFTSVDPAPASSGLLRGPPKAENTSEQSIKSLQEHLVDISLPLFDRYRAMFALRNIGTKPAVDALASGFTDDSELFKYIHLITYFIILYFFEHRHEIAFIFGQLLSPHSVPALLKVLQDNSESDMVRHEAAEALGGIATPEVLPHLREWMNKEDAPNVVRESCQVAIDMWEVCSFFCLEYGTDIESCFFSTRTQMSSSTPMAWKRRHPSRWHNF